MSVAERETSQFRKPMGLRVAMSNGILHSDRQRPVNRGLWFVRLRYHGACFAMHCRMGSKV